MSITASGGWCMPVDAYYDVCGDFFTSSCVDPTVDCDHYFVCNMTHNRCTWCGKVEEPGDRPIDPALIEYVRDRLRPSDPHVWDGDYS